MVGIYKITSPNGRIYIGQSIDLERRRTSYSRQDCGGQPRLHKSLAKYGFFKHTFEIVEECLFEELNIRERYWQDLYDVLGEMGLNCILTETNEKPRVISQESRYKQSTTHKALHKTQKGREARAKQVANTDYNSFQEKRMSNRDEVARAKKSYKAILQVSKDGVCIREWASIKQASETLGLYQGNISTCLGGKTRTSGGFIWKYKEEEL